MHNISHAQPGLRDHLRDLRDAQDPSSRSRGALLVRGRLFTWLATYRLELQQRGRPVPRRVAAFWSMPDEPGLQPLLRQWVEEEGLEVSLPVVAQRDAPLAFHLWTPDTEMAAGAYGIAEPQGTAAAAPPDIVLVPTLGYTRRGDRVGYGKGYYDRTLAAWEAAGHRPLRIGIAWATGDLSETDYTPAPHDMPLDSILTDKGWAVPAPVAA